MEAHAATRAPQRGVPFRLTEAVSIEVARLLRAIPHTTSGGTSLVKPVRDLLHSIYDDGMPDPWDHGSNSSSTGFALLQSWIKRDSRLAKRFDDAYDGWDQLWWAAEKRRSPAAALEALQELARPQESKSTDVATPSVEAPQPFAIQPYVWQEPGAIEPRQWLGRSRHMIRDFVSVTASPGGTGKTSLLLVECLEMATGRRLLCAEPDREPTATPLRVYYWNGEDPYIEVQRRIQAACLHYGIQPQELAGRLFVGTADTVKIMVAGDSRQGVDVNEPLFGKLVAELKANKIDAFVADPFIRTHMVPENDNGKIDAVLHVFRRIARECQIGVELVHHVRKTGGEEITAEDMRGASALHGAARSVRVINPMTEGEAKRARIGERRSHFRVDDGKPSMKKWAAKSARWYQLVSVGLRNARKGLAGDEVGVATSWSWPDVMDGVPEDALRLAQDAVRSGEGRADPRSPQWAGLAVGRALGFDMSVSFNTLHVKQLIKEWIDSGGLVRVKRADKDRKLRDFIEPGAPVQ